MMVTPATITTMEAKYSTVPFVGEKLVICVRNLGVFDEFGQP